MCYTLTYTQPGLNWRPSACWADVIATRPRCPYIFLRNLVLVCKLAARTFPLHQGVAGRPNMRRRSLRRRALSSHGCQSPAPASSCRLFPNLCVSAVRHQSLLARWVVDAGDTCARGEQLVAPAAALVTLWRRSCPKMVTLFYDARNRRSAHATVGRCVIPRGTATSRLAEGSSPASIHPARIEQATFSVLG